MSSIFNFLVRHPCLLSFPPLSSSLQVFPRCSTHTDSPSSSSFSFSFLRLSVSRPNPVIDSSSPYSPSSSSTLESSTPRQQQQPSLLFSLLHVWKNKEKEKEEGALLYVWLECVSVGLVERRRKREEEWLVCLFLPLWLTSSLTMLLFLLGVGFPKNASQEIAFKNDWFDWKSHVFWACLNIGYWRVAIIKW